MCVCELQNYRLLLSDRIYQKIKCNRWKDEQMYPCWNKRRKTLSKPKLMSKRYEQTSSYLAYTSQLSSTTSFRGAFEPQKLLHTRLELFSHASEPTLGWERVTFASKRHAPQIRATWNTSTSLAVYLMRKQEGGGERERKKENNPGPTVAATTVPKLVKLPAHEKQGARVGTKFLLGGDAVRTKIQLAPRRWI